MKQHITQEQLEELQGIGKIRLADILFPYSFGVITPEMVTIGIMFEAVAENILFGHNIRFKVGGVLRPYWNITLIGDDDDDDDEVDGEFAKDELCDALWEATKLKLGKPNHYGVS